MILSLPDEWNYTTRGLAAICKEGVDSIGAALRELESTGYIIRRRLRDEKGKIVDTEYTIYERPQKPHNDSPHIGEPDTDEPCTGNTAQYNTNQTNPKKANTDGVNNHQSIPQGASLPQQNNRPDWMDRIDEIERYRKLILFEEYIAACGCEGYVAPQTVTDYVLNRQGFLVCECMNRKIGRMTKDLKLSPYVTAGQGYYKAMRDDSC